MCMQADFEHRRYHKHTAKKMSVKGREIIESIQVSDPYFGQVICPLTSAGLVKTTRGCKGGYLLNRPPNQITMFDIIRVFETHFSEDDNEDVEIMTANSIWDTLNDTLNEKSKIITLQSILDEIEAI